VNLLEQTIGRVIRTESHAHLPPEKRNVCVYQYATVLSGAYKDRESIDLRVYAICEGKAVKSGAVELVLKENAIDCMMNRPLNFRSKTDYPTAINITTSHGMRVAYNLWDAAYSRDSLYMPNSNYKCLAASGSASGVVVAAADSDKYMADKRKTTARVLGKELEMYKLEIDEIISIINTQIKKHNNLMSVDIWNIISDVLRLDKSPEEFGMAQNIYAYLADYFTAANIKLLDGFGRECSLVVLKENPQYSGDMNFILRLIPLTEYNPSLALANQFKLGVDMGDKKDGYYYSRHMSSKADEKRHIFSDEPIGSRAVEAVHINPLVQLLRREKLKFIDKQELDYGGILAKLEKQIADVRERRLSTGSDLATVGPSVVDSYFFETNIKLTDKFGFLELYKVIFDRQLFVEKLYILQNLVAKIRFRVELSRFEQMLVRVCRFNLVCNDEIFKSGLLSAADSARLDFIHEPDELYGFLIARFNKLVLYRFDTNSVVSTGKVSNKYDERYVKDLFVEDKAKYGSLVDKRWRGAELNEGRAVNSLFGYLVYTKSDTLPPIFKITDYLTKGYKKSVKGVSCNSKSVPEIIQYIKIIEPDYKSYGIQHNKSRRVVCGDLELFCRVSNTRNPGRKFFLSPEEYAIWQTYKE
jgi:hypothetical protein